MEAFLLGRCEEGVALQIEELLFTDDLVYQQMEQTKASLIAREVRGHLAPQLSSDLALQCARSPKLRSEVQFARDGLLESRRELSVAAPPFLQPSAAAWRWSASLAAAIFLVIMVGGVLRIRKASEIRSAKHPSTAPSSTLSGDRSSVVKNPAAPAGTAAASILFLPSDVLRGSADSALLTAPSQDRPVEIQLQVRARDSDGKLWSATLFRGSRNVLQVQQVVSKSAGTVHYVSILVPAGTLTAGQYRLALTPAVQDPAGEPILVSRTFTLARGQ